MTSSLILADSLAAGKRAPRRPQQRVQVHAAGIVSAAHRRVLAAHAGACAGGAAPAAAAAAATPTLDVARCALAYQ